VPYPGDSPEEAIARIERERAAARGDPGQTTLELMMPKILDEAVKKIAAKGDVDNPYAVATAALQKSGSLKPGTVEPTKQGVARGQMTPAEREAKPPGAPTARDHAAGLVKSYRAK
jgi:hypothetical protein